MTLAWGTIMQSAAWLQALELFQKTKGPFGETPDKYKQRGDEAQRRFDALRKSLEGLLDELAGCKCPNTKLPKAAKCLALKDWILRRAEQMSYDMGTTFRAEAWIQAMKEFGQKEGWPGETPENQKKQKDAAGRRVDEGWKDLNKLLDELERCGCPPEPDRSTEPSPSGTVGEYLPDKPFLAQGYKFENKIEFGMNRSFLGTPYGTITLNLPADLVFGEPFTGTIYLDPAGKTEKERGQNANNLKQYEITALGSGPLPVSTYLPDPLTLIRVFGDAARNSKLDLSLKNDSVIRVTIPDALSPIFDKPIGYAIPTAATAGSFFKIPGPFNGLPDGYITIGGEKVPILTESPSGIVVWDRTEIIGETKIELNESGQTGQCGFRNVGVRVSATNLSLKRGEHATVHVTFTGLAGLDQNMPYFLVNHSPGVISMEGGVESKNRVVPASSVTNLTGPELGTFTDTIGITGVSPGNFTITSTLHWKDTCNPFAGGSAKKP